MSKWQVVTAYDGEGVQVQVLSPDGDGTEATIDPSTARQVAIDLIEAAFQQEDEFTTTVRKKFVDRAGVERYEDTTEPTGRVWNQDTKQWSGEYAEPANA